MIVDLGLGSSPTVDEDLRLVVRSLLDGAKTPNTREVLQQFADAGIYPIIGGDVLATTTVNMDIGSFAVNWHADETPNVAVVGFFRRLGLNATALAESGAVDRVVKQLLDNYEARALNNVITVGGAYRRAS